MITPDDLAQINRHTRRDLSEDELYVFPLVLCDNEIDRDGERFSIDALQKLSELYLGKTGIFDHNPKGENQTARIFSAEVKRDAERSTRAGEPYHSLTARAYMVRSNKNRDLILDIDAGIKKEVSVACAVAETLCSVCGKDVTREPCEHLPGKTYGGAECHRVLNKPTDAYEWSFVAVPAQPAAGVTKVFGSTPAQSRALPEGWDGMPCQEAKRLRALAADGEAYRSSLKKELLRAAALCGGLEGGTAVAIADKLNAGELRALKKAFTRFSGGTPPLVQLSPVSHTPEHGNKQFLI